jgi:hypothetical protein
MFLAAGFRTPDKTARVEDHSCSQLSVESRNSMCPSDPFPAFAPMGLWRQFPGVQRQSRRPCWLVHGQHGADIRVYSFLRGPLWDVPRAPTGGSP